MMKLKQYLVASIVILIGLAYLARHNTVQAPTALNTSATPQADVSCARPDGTPWDFSERKIQVGEHDVSVAVADTQAEQARGVGGCTKLSINSGMYFVFSPAGTVTFWMKDTLIPLDMIWIADGKVVGMQQNVQPQPGVPDDQLNLYSSNQDVDGVLEVPAGTVAQLGITVGTSVK